MHKAWDSTDSHAYQIAAYIETNWSICLCHRNVESLKLEHKLCFRRAMLSLAEFSFGYTESTIVSWIGMLMVTYVKSHWIT